MRRQKKENRLLVKKKKKVGNCIIYTGSFPIGVNCFKSQRNNRQTELACGGKNLFIKLGKCLGFFLSVSKRLRKR